MELEESWSSCMLFEHMRRQQVGRCGGRHKLPSTSHISPNPLPFQSVSWLGHPSLGLIKITGGQEEGWVGPWDGRHLGDLHKVGMASSRDGTRDAPHMLPQKKGCYRPSSPEGLNGYLGLLFGR